MKPDLDTFIAACPGLDEGLVEEHLARLTDDYFGVFSLAEAAKHIECLARLSPENPVEILFDAGEGRRLDATVLAFDHRGEFSLIAGCLAALGFDVSSGDIFTFGGEREAAQAGPRRRRTERRDGAAADPRFRRRIIDRFSGEIPPGADREAWCGEARARLAAVLGLLERVDEDSAGKAAHLVNDGVARRLAELEVDAASLLFPVSIEVDNDAGPWTSLRVVSQDTPMFLYALSNALALQGIAIERVRIRTHGRRIEDRLDVLDARGRKITDAEQLSRIKLAVLLTKQFTYFLNRAPDPYMALARFEQLVGRVLEGPEHGRWLELLSKPDALKDLARLFGASEYIWEDLIRQQYETLLPMLAPHLGGRRFAESPTGLRQCLDAALAGAETLEARCRVLNEFKDRELFLIDLDHILCLSHDVRVLAENLTRLAEVVVAAACRIVYDDLVARHGEPRTVAGLPARWAVFGLGKLGGVALGYASDVELLFVYSDSGRTSGPDAVENSEFFGALVKKLSAAIVAKREGIFQVDVRLRPYGLSGPWACSLESFCDYYGAGGKAHSYERLALVRLRAIGGDPELGRQVERLRDEFLYAADSIRIPELRELRARQLKEKVPPGACNVKFSPGALVDIEYDVQILQIMYGKDRPRLRTPRIHEALAGLSEAGVLSAEESAQLGEAYYFLRRLINGLRMLRGSAQDLFLPAMDADEFTHLARRMGYERGGPLEPAQALRADFETHTARVRAFIERHFGRESLPGPAGANIADVVLSEQMPEDARRKILVGLGFGDPARAAVNLRCLAGSGAQRDAFARLAVLASDYLRGVPDCDMALNNWERFVSALAAGDARERHFALLMRQPKRLEILVGILAGSQFVADTLIRDTEFLDWVTDPENLHAVRDAAALGRELAAFGGLAHDAWRNAVRRFRRREILRIATRDICLRAAITSVVADLSSLAEAMTAAALERVWRDLAAECRAAGVEEPARRFCILAFGKLGGGELNYSSDIDLLGVCDEAGADPEARAAPIFDRAMELVHRALSAHTEEGYAYRVDVRLRPYGRAGHLVFTRGELGEYYRTRAALWEVQALLKLRPIAGALDVGRRLLDDLAPVLCAPRKAAEVARAIDAMRQKAARAGAEDGIDVKSGVGGIRDVEFLVQGLQLVAASRTSAVLSGNTLQALDLLARAGVLPAETAAQLAQDYAFLRRVEHCLQIMEDQQIHVLPGGEAERTALARRVLGGASTAGDFMAALTECRDRVRAAYVRHLRDGGTGSPG